MKNIIIFVLVIIILAILGFIAYDKFQIGRVGKGQSNEPEKVNKIDKNKDYVYPTLTVDHTSGNEDLANVDAVSNVPVLNLNVERVKNINKTISKWYYDMIPSNYAKREAGKFTYDMNFMTYENYKNNDVISLVVKQNNVSNKSKKLMKEKNYKIYNVNKNNGEELRSDDLLKQVYKSHKDVYEQLTKYINNYFNTPMAKKLSNEAKSKYINEYQNIRITKDKIDAPMYINKDGKLAVLINLPVPSDEETQAQIVVIN